MYKQLEEIPHYRENILTGENVLVSPQRSKRPWVGNNEKQEITNKSSYNNTCYLCPTNLRTSGTKNLDYKSVFVFDNDFQALLKSEAKLEQSSSLLKFSLESGICRVICYSPDHSKTMSNLLKSEILEVINTWASQYKELSAHQWINHIQIFENKGEVMGCSNPHPHGQIWAQSSIPTEVEKETTNQLEYFRKFSSILLIDYLKTELKENERIIIDSEYFVVLVPFWAVWPFETIILPKKHFKNLHDLNQIEKLDLAQILIDLSKTYDTLFNCSFPYSMGIHQAPCDGKEHNEWQLHFHFYPPLLRSSTIKKFMVGYEMMASPQRDITAESAAKQIRESYKQMRSK